MDCGCNGMVTQVSAVEGIVVVGGNERGWPTSIDER